MKSIKDVYPESFDSNGIWHSWYAYDYRPLLESFGHEVLLQVDEGGYSGDSIVLYKNDKRYGVLLFGWGSCCGCDALQACGSEKEVEDLREELVKKIVWQTDRDAALQYIRTKDWEGEWIDNELASEFFSGAIKILEVEKE